MSDDLRTESFVERYLNRRIVMELAPGLIFFVVNYGWGLMAATAAVMIATLLAVCAARVLDGRLPALAIFTLVFVCALGSTSLAFGDETFIKIKLTVGNCLFAAALAIGLRFRPSLLERTFEDQLRLADPGWFVLTSCWIAFALFSAAFNEAVWRTMSTDSWVAIKTAFVPLSIVAYFTITRIVAGQYWHEPPERL
ncbi:MAG: septation protein IspZ [Alphaproteobacteria bacterium GM202ARS2]|nr:septation protein IspZ [Alphaproteobacteria bacterium GM202ARS2]